MQKWANKKISILKQNSNNWGLFLNLSKRKIMIFDKQGATIRKFNFYFQGPEMEIVKQYKYKLQKLLKKRNRK